MKSSGFLNDTKGDSVSVALKLVICHGDLEQIDAKRAREELWSQRDISGEARVELHLELEATARKAKEALAFYKHSIAEDPGVAAADKLARKVWKSWQVSGDKDLVAARDQFLRVSKAAAAKKKSAHAGCRDDIWPSLARALSSVAFEIVHEKDGNLASGYEPQRFIAADPTAMMYALSYQACAQAEKQDKDLVTALFSGRGGSLFNWYLGPRSHTATVLASKFSELPFDSKDAELSSVYLEGDLAPASRATRNPVYGAMSMGPEVSYLSGTRQGFISKVTKGKDTVHVVFRPQMGKVTYCDDWRPTKRVRAIKSDGTLDYDTRCAKWITSNENFASDPVEVEARLAGGIKPGVWGYFGVDGKYAIPFYIANSAAKGLVATHVFGVALKK